MAIQNEEKKHLSAKGMLSKARLFFEGIKTPSKKGAGNKPTISLADCLMSGLAIFSLKFPSLLQFDKAVGEGTIKHNLESLYGVEKAPCDTQLRERLDVVNPNKIRGVFKKIFSTLQRGKVLEKYKFINGCYMLVSDGTGFFSSSTVHCKNCCVKQHRNGSITYYHQMLAAAIVHPDHKEVIPLCPEPIAQSDGSKKNDCERNASKRLLADVRREYPHLPLILAEDGLASNAPHLRLCNELNIRFITVVKPDGNKTLFEWLKGIGMQTKEFTDEKGHRHRMEFYNDIPLNDADPTLKVNFVEYWEFLENGEKKYHSTWITDIEITQENVFSIVQGGRARWKIENETFNTLKNQGYKFEHNYGHGNNYLSTVFAMLMMLAFLIDQVQQICCGLFNSARKRYHAKIVLWEKLRNTFAIFKLDSWETLYKALAQGVEGKLVLNTS
ncbi:transposase [Candidatus Neptunochlamydia vexilliferae]|uniref:Transposase n=1 Tax=Candidatus Neptunichlamydia vexilliferae TaxID=1651774 RepID=A0ABS0AYR9_9BACT|nr:transposase [Candidatus Neptunochlamydia vexilliferae]MBF5059115.1 hypothetical protein [Candidatus Neptunochlamydia vexilliferae]